MEIDFTPPYKRIPFMVGLREALGLQDDPQWPPNTTLHTEEARQYFLRLVRAQLARLLQSLMSLAVFIQGWLPPGYCHAALLQCLERANLLLRGKLRT